MHERSRTQLRFTHPSYPTGATLARARSKVARAAAQSRLAPAIFNGCSVSPRSGRCSGGLVEEARMDQRFRFVLFALAPMAAACGSGELPDAIGVAAQAQ